MHSISKKSHETEGMSCSVLLDDSGIIKNTYESQSDGLDLGRCPLAVLSISRLYSIFVVALRKKYHEQVKAIPLQNITYFV